MDRYGIRRPALAAHNTQGLDFASGHSLERRKRTVAEQPYSGITWLDASVLVASANPFPGKLVRDPSSFGIKLLERSEELMSEYNFTFSPIEVVEDIYNNHNNGSELVREYAWPNNNNGLRIWAIQGGLEEGLPITFTNPLMVRYSRYSAQVYKPYNGPNSNACIAGLLTRKYKSFPDPPPVTKRGRNVAYEGRIVMESTYHEADTAATDGYLSSDSSFYGDAVDRARLEENASHFDPALYWDNHPHLLPVVAAANRAKLEAASSTSPSKPLYNPYEGSICGRQLNEPVEDFLKRLPPLTTTRSLQYPWIFIANPHATSRPTDRDQAGFTKVAEELLLAFSDKTDEIETSMAGKPKGSVTRKLTPLRKALENDLFAAAKKRHCTSGKWMLFPYPEDVNRHWAIVATATVNRELGTAAKVAPDDGKGDRVPRLICVYTKDFSDIDDVKRVLGRLVELGLVKKKGAGEERGIYYKADAFTELGINSGNEWGLKASLYASKDLLEARKK
ncbi:MAG: hypothetical protein Q9221_004007 [Calogaya cf. arnoldii]